MIKLVIRNPEEVEPKVKLFLEQEGDDVVLCAEDTSGVEWALVRVKPDGTIELCACVDSDDFCTDDGYVMTARE
jgi:hypothetical protein